MHGVPIEHTQQDETINECILYIKSIKDLIVSRIDNGSTLKNEHFLKLIDIVLNTNTVRLQYFALHSLNALYNQLISCKYSMSYDDHFEKLIPKLIQIISTKGMNTDNIRESILLFALLSARSDLDQPTKFNVTHCLQSLSKLSNPYSYIELLGGISYTMSQLLYSVNFVEEPNEKYFGEIIRNLNFLITYDSEEILVNTLTSYDYLFCSNPHIAPKLTEYTLNEQKFEQESESKVNEDESLVNMFANKYCRKYKCKLLPMSLIKFITNYLSPICKNQIKLKTLDPIQRFVELIINPSEKVKVKIVNLLYEIIVIGTVYIYLFDVSKMMDNLIIYMLNSEKLLFRSFNLMMCCISFGDEEVIAKLDVDMFMYFIAKTIENDKIEVNQFVFTGIEKLIKLYTNNENDYHSMNKLWNTLDKMERNDKILQQNADFINRVKHEMM